MKRFAGILVPAALICLPASALKADVTMRLLGRVVSQDGKPIPGAKITIKKIDTGWKVEVTAGEDGTFARAGITPDPQKVYEITVTKDGFAPWTNTMAIPLKQEPLRLDVTLLPAGAGGDAQGGAAPAPEDPGQKADTEAREAFNKAIPLLKSGQKDAALPLLKQAYESMGTAADTMKDELRKADVLAIYPQIARIYGNALVEAGKQEEAIAPLSKAVELAPNDKASASAAKALVDIYGAKKDSANKAKYQAVLDALVGPDPSTEYNAAAQAFNAGKMAPAKQHLLKAISIDPKFPDSYYLLGLVELNAGDMAGAKTHFHKYLELAPSGKHAQEIRDMGM